MKKLLTITLMCIGSVMVLGQNEGSNPFAKYGYTKVKTYTSSKGEFEEFHDQTEVVQIGSVWFNPQTNKIDSFVREAPTVVPQKIKILKIRLSVDPEAARYYWITPYNYCLNNPVKMIDPNGMEVIAGDEVSQNNIKNTLTIQEAKYVRFDKNGVLDTKRLNKSKSTSENMTALKELANSDTKYRFKVTDKDHRGESFGNNGNGNFYNGVTEMPGAQKDPSIDNDVHVLVGNHLSGEEAASTTAHEAYGHAYFYELKQQGQNVEVNHTYSAELLDNGTCCKGVPSNHVLENQITKVTNQAKINYQSRKK